MLFHVLGCLPAAALYPVDPCRVGAEWEGIHAEATCTLAGTTVETRSDWQTAFAAGGRQGEGWEGLSFFVSDGSMDVGWRPGSVGVAAQAMVAGFDPRSTETPDPPGVQVDACSDEGEGEVVLGGLPEAWVAGGEWRLDFGGGAGASSEVAAAWSSPWPSDCPLHPKAWAAVRLEASCAGESLAELQFLAPVAYSLVLDELGGVRSVDAVWEASFDASCAGVVSEPVGGTLTGAEGALVLETPLLSLVRDAESDWRVETTRCGVCPTGWAVTVEGLPRL